MWIKQYYLGCLAHASYLIADEKTGVAAVVDPQRDVEQYLKDAEDHGLTIRHVFLTHFHADFLAGHIELRNRVGARIHLGARAQAEYEFNPVKDGDVIEFGDVRLTVMETPGHTPEGVSIVVHDLAESSENPKAVLTGDTLFIGDVGRPDLFASIGVTSEELGEMLYDSITNKLMKLPDETIVYPAHGAGSLCGKQLSKETRSTIGEQKRYNYALQPMSREAFLQMVTADQPDAPEYFAYDATKNRQERPGLDEQISKSLRPLPLPEVVKPRPGGVQLLDVREGADFEGAHLVGSINIGLKGQYATWCGTLLDHERPIVVIAEPGGEEEAVMRLGRIGFDNVIGYLEGGMSSLADRPDLVGKTDRITSRALAERIAAGDAPVIVDVRSASEREAGYIEGSLNIPLNRLIERNTEIPRDRDVVAHCQGGYRSAIAVSLLKHLGFPNAADLVGGHNAWKAGAETYTRPAVGGSPIHVTS